MTVRVRPAPGGWWPNLVEAACNACGWRGYVRDVNDVVERLLVRLDADEHTCDARYAAVGEDER